MWPVELSAAHHRAWLEDGVVCLRAVFAPSWLKMLEEGFAQAIAAPGPLAKSYGAGEGRFLTDHAMFRRIGVLRRFVFESPVVEVAAKLLESRNLNLVDDHLLVKEPGADRPTYWHHDYPYFQFSGDHFISFWIPLDAVDQANGAMRFAVGSHRWGKLFHPVRIGEGDLVAEAEAFDGPVPDIDGCPDLYRVVSWDLNPGDCIAFHGKTLHAAGGNSTTGRRRALAVRYTGDDIRWHPRPFAPVDDTERNLAAGGPIDCEGYPVVRSAGR